MKNVIGAKGAKHLKELLLTDGSMLQFLDVSGNFIGDKGMYQISLGLKKNTRIEVLNLAQNGISSFGIDFMQEALIQNEENNLVELNISNNKFGILGVSYLKRYLTHDNCKLTSLEVSSCGISGKGALNFFLALKYCYKLESVNMSFNNLSDTNVRNQMSRALGHSIKYINLNYCQMGDIGA